MELKLVICIVSAAMTVVTSQFQTVRVPPGALVELEFEFINPPPGQAAGRAGGMVHGMPQQMAPAGGEGAAHASGMGQGQMMALTQMMPQMMGATGQMMPHMVRQMMGPTQMMLTMPGGPPGSALHLLLSNMVKMALALRRIYGVTKPLPPMEEPCPCDADCCALPTAPRRILPVLSIPMTLHRGCCGCVECPASLSPMINGMIQAAKLLGGKAPPAEAK